MLKRSFLMSLVLLAAVSLFTLGDLSAYAPVLAPSPSPCDDSVCYIFMNDFVFDLDNITILSPNPATGQNVTVCWYNNGSYAHSVVTGLPPPDIPDGLIDQIVTPGTFFNLTITPSFYSQILSIYPNGVLPYYCMFHYSDDMTATLTISTTQIPEFPGTTMLLTLTLVACAVSIFMRKRKLL